ncbi:hypothetical protein AHAS_Ahas01G0154700 [Arachis hypogaea]
MPLRSSDLKAECAFYSSSNDEYIFKNRVTYCMVISPILHCELLCIAPSTLTQDIGFWLQAVGDFLKELQNRFEFEKCCECYNAVICFNASAAVFAF